MQNRRWIIITAGATGLKIAPEVRRQIQKRGEPAEVLFMDYDATALAIAQELGFIAIELDWAGDFALKRIRAALEELGWDVNSPIGEPRNNPRRLRPVVMANMGKLKSILDAEVREMGEKGGKDLIILIIEGAAGPTSATSGLTTASEMDASKREWKARYPLLSVHTYGIEAIPVDFRQGNGVDDNAVNGYFSRLNRAKLMESGLFDHMFVVNGPDYYPTEPDDLTLPRFSRRLAGGIGHLLGLKVLETNTDSTTPFDYLQIMQSLPPQANVCFFEVGYPQVPDLRALQTAAGLVRDGKCWSADQRSVLGDILADQGADTAPLDRWQEKYTMAVTPWWLVASAAGIAVGGAATSYLLAQWPWQSLGAGCSLLIGGILAGAVAFTRWHRKEQARRGVLNLLGDAFDKLLQDCRTPRVIPPTFRPGFNGEVKDLLRKPLTQILLPADVEFTRARVQDFVSRLVPEGTETVHLITVADPALVKAFGFTNADVAAMTGAKTCCGYSSEAPGLDFYVRYILVYGAVPDAAMRGWEVYQAFGEGADGRAEQFDAWPENEKAVGGKQ